MFRFESLQLGLGLTQFTLEVLEFVSVVIDCLFPVNGQRPAFVGTREKRCAYFCSTDSSKAPTPPSLKRSSRAAEKSRARVLDYANQ